MLKIQRWVKITLPLLTAMLVSHVIHTCWRLTISSISTGFILGGNSQSEDHRPANGTEGIKSEAAGYEGLFRKGED